MDSKKGIKNIDNMEINENEKYALISVNPKIYSLDIIQYACYAFLDDAEVILDDDKKELITVKLRPKKSSDLESLGRRFNDELLNYAVYKNQSEKNRAVKEAIVQKALFTNQGAEEDIEEAPFEKESYEDDPLGISKPFGSGDKK